MEVTSVFLLISLSCGVVSSNPTLSNNETLNAHCVCDMTGFHRRLDSLVALQIAKKAVGGQGEDVVLATVDSGGARLSDKLLNGEKQRHFVSGQLDVLQKRDASLNMTITDFAEDEEGVYSCHIHYMDHPADTKHSTWSRELTVNRSVSQATQTPGFRVWVSQGVHIRCDYSDTTDYVINMTISATERSWSATWCDEGNQTTCTPGLLGPYHRRQKSSAQDTLEVHIPSVTCEHQSQHVCIVTTTSSKTLKSSSVPLQLKICPRRLQTESTVTVTASSTVASSTTAVGGVPSVWFYVAPVIVAVVVLACVGVLCFLRRRRRQPGDKSLNKRSFWGRMNGGFTHTNKLKPRSPAEMENDVNGVLENIGGGKSGEDPLLPGKVEKERDGTLESTETSKLEEDRLLTKLNDDISPSTETNNASLESDKNIDFPPEIAINVDDKKSYSERSDIDMAKPIFLSRGVSDSSEESSSSDSSSPCTDTSLIMKTPIQASESSEPCVVV